MDFWNARPSRKNRIPSFLNAPVRSMKPSPMFVKQSINTPRRRLTPWGDIDMDGSPNKFDCNPFNPAEDGIISRILGTDKERQKRKFEEKVEKKSKGFIERREAREKFKEGLKRRSQGVTKFIDRAFTPKNINPKSGRYSKESLRAQKRFAGRTLGLVRLLTPPGTVTQTGKGKGKGKKGRPEGPSGKYFIPGVGPVGVYQYRTWLRQQRKISRLKMRESPVAMEVPQEDYSEGITPAQTVSLDEAVPARQFNQTNRIEQPMQPTLITPAGTDGLSYQQQMQLIMQQRDNILLAPQFLKGELKGAGGDILSDTGRPNILQAPNINLGQMRNLQARNPVELGERPITNPSGNYFTTIDPITGNPILQRRVTEKWLTGEAI